MTFEPIDRHVETVGLQLIDGLARTARRSHAISVSPLAPRQRIWVEVGSGQVQLGGLFYRRGRPCCLWTDDA
jgi:hypothetical protein